LLSQALFNASAFFWGLYKAGHAGFVKSKEDGCWMPYSSYGKACKIGKMCLLKQASVDAEG